uniref:Sulfate Permease (SulP) Family putative n=1 Tax=Albugo laibachii Nc14 TaxID=890382 RepID=F0W553_9STRA|nr:Sulfate Permease (SulP) Family putative [Albugo laibachii Nc14]|eukprot:CCA16244.1 Sulfate Permease (SulP) Family putative [Albugo laibachii Nc14]
MTKHGLSVRLILDVLQAILSGIIITIVICPCLLGFSTLIFSHHDFEPYLPLLIKLVFMSSIVHQLIITISSPLHFAIGQVQDAGLIFLSIMATSIMDQLASEGVPMEERISTVLIHLSLSSAIVGIGLIALGRFRLASFVQYLPTPVIGGYLAYIGFFLIKGGLSLMTNVHLTGLPTWLSLLTYHNASLMGPGILCGIALSILTNRFGNVSVFPCCVISMPIVFFVIIYLNGSSLQDARLYGYLALDEKGVNLTEMYHLFDFKSIQWHAMFPAQLPTILSMFIVISFASSLDIAAICMGTGVNLNYNQQLQVVGYSNLFSGITGGYTGSYIFSQTLFASRFQVKDPQAPLTRVIGLTLILCEGVIVSMRFSLMSVIPKFLFGSVMIYIGIELLCVWLFGVYTKLLVSEYIVVVFTFVALNMFGIEIGLSSGIALAAFSFILEYSRNQEVRTIQKSSNVIRTMHQYNLLHGRLDSSNACQDLTHPTSSSRPIVTIQLQGHIFFGSATKILSCVKRLVYVEHSDRRTETLDPEKLPLLRCDSKKYIRALVDLKGNTCIDPDQERTQYVVFDFSAVSGMDATAAGSCFLVLKSLFQRHDIRGVYCGMNAEIEALLRANDVIPSNWFKDTPYHPGNTAGGHVTTDLDSGLEWCEENIIFNKAPDFYIASHKRKLSLSSILQAYLPAEKQIFFSTNFSSDQLEDIFRVQTWQKNQKIFGIGDDPIGWYVLLRGRISLFSRPTIKRSAHSPLSASRHSKSYDSALQLSLSGSTVANGTSDTSHPSEWLQLFGRVHAGCVFGDLDFVLQQSRQTEAVVTCDETLTALITRDKLNFLEKNGIEMAFILQQIMMRASYIPMVDKLHSNVV